MLGCVNVAMPVRHISRFLVAESLIKAPFIYKDLDNDTNLLFNKNSRVKILEIII